MSALCQRDKMSDMINLKVEEDNLDSLFQRLPGQWGIMAEACDRESLFVQWQWGSRERKESGVLRPLSRSCFQWSNFPLLFSDPLSFYHFQTDTGALGETSRIQTITVTNREELYFLYLSLAQCLKYIATTLKVKNDVSPEWVWTCPWCSVLKF